MQGGQEIILILLALRLAIDCQSSFNDMNNQLDSDRCFSALRCILNFWCNANALHSDTHTHVHTPQSYSLRTFL